jgi:riboflavin kinase/FMN adenylyltransferase
MEGQLTFLGTGTSMGVPTLGCNCAVCTSSDPHDRRLRPSVLLQWNDGTRDRVVLIDTGPDFREQALRNKLTRVDAVFYTHSHADHIFGLDDLRPLSFTVFREGGHIPLYASPETEETLRRVYDYTFSPKATYPNRPRVHIEPLSDRATVFGVEFTRVPVFHGELGINGFRFGRTAYLTDVSRIPEESFALLEGLDYVVLSALRHKPHPNHATVEQAVEWAKRIGAKHTWLTHIAHELGHEETNAKLPDNIRMAYDGLSFPIELARSNPMSRATVSSGRSSSVQSTTVPVYRSLEEVPPDFGPSIAAIGNFDGVHRGHQQILSAAAEEARARGMRSIAITFNPHPAQFLYPKEAPKLLTFLPERLRLLAKTGVDAVLVLPFDEALSRVPAEDFVRKVLVGMLQVRGIHEGGNFRFGHGAKAGIAELRTFGEEFGFNVQVHPPVRVHGLEVSSSAVRTLIAEGDVRRARWMLGRVFGVHSHPAKGRGVGTKLLVPTVNLAPYEGLLPGFGVYVTRLTIDDRCFEAVTNVGNRPTFEGVGFGVETHILDFTPVDLTDETSLRLDFLLRLRGEMQWPSTEPLKAQIFKDVGRAKRYFRIAALRQGDPSLR